MPLHATTYKSALYYYLPQSISSEKAVPTVNLKTAILSMDSPDSYALLAG